MAPSSRPLDEGSWTRGEETGSGWRTRTAVSGVSSRVSGFVGAVRLALVNGHAGERVQHESIWECEESIDRDENGMGGWMRRATYGE
ncbi:unnamed protein product [Cutaneotrichosporon oleaginosum]